MFPIQIGIVKMIDEVHVAPQNRDENKYAFSSVTCMRAARHACLFV